MKIKKDNLYYIFIAIATFVFYMRHFNSLYKIINYIVYALAAISITVYALYWMFEEFSAKERLMHICLLSGIFIVYYLSGMKYEYLIFTALAVIGMKNKSIKKVMYITFFIYFMCLIVHVILVFAGIIEDEIFIKVSSGKKIVTHRFGFSHGNTAFTILFTSICSYVYYRFEKIKIWQLVVIEIISLVLYFVFYARTGLLIITLFLLGTAIFKFTKNKENMILKIFRRLEITIIPMMFIGTYLLSTVFYDTNIATIINNLVSDRLKISNVYFGTIPPGLFPKNFEFIGDLSFDNMYSFIMSSFGLIFTGFVIVVFVALYIKLLKEKRYFEMYIITLFALYSYSERMYINSFKNPSILFLGVLLYKNFNMFDCEEKK